MPTVLVVDDDPQVASRISRALEREGFTAVLAGTGRAALASVDENQPELILLDLMLPDCDGFELCNALRENPITSHVPIIMLTARAHSAAKVEGLTIGADDYVAKPFDEDELMARIKSHLRRYAQERAVNPLTQLPGNLDIDRFIDDTIAKQAPYAVLYVDLDNFKAYNDHYGFGRGDEVLLFVGDILRSVAQSNGGSGRDFVGHVGGDDFVVVTSPAMIDHYCTSIINQFDDGIAGRYDNADASRGCIESTDRRGVRRSYPVLSVTIAVVTNEHRRIINRLEIGEIAAQLKRVGKREARSSYHVDQRRTTPA